tara:strand:+ start:130 stop:303 length:174 start_codon:yes stop_codon:yes gene_type:complete
LTNESEGGSEAQGFTSEQMKDIFVKLTTSRVLIKMGENMAKEIEEDLKFYRAVNNDL